MPRPDVIPTSVQLGPRAMAFHEFLAAAARARRGRPARVCLFLGEWPGAPAPSTRPAQRPRNARADGHVRGARKRRSGMGEASRSGVASAYPDNAGQSPLSQPHATAESPKPRVKSHDSRGRPLTGVPFWSDHYRATPCLPTDPRSDVYDSPLTSWRNDAL